MRRTEDRAIRSVLKLQRGDRPTFPDVGSAVVVEPKGVFAVAEDVGDRAVRLAGVEHRRRGEVAKLEQRDGRSPRWPTIDP